MVMRSRMGALRGQKQRKTTYTLPPPGAGRWRGAGRAGLPEAAHDGRGAGAGTRAGEGDSTPCANDHESELSQQILNPKTLKSVGSVRSRGRPYLPPGDNGAETGALPTPGHACAAAPVDRTAPSGGRKGTRARGGFAAGGACTLPSRQEVDRPWWQCGPTKSSRICRP